MRGVSSVEEPAQRFRSPGLTLLSHTFQGPGWSPNQPAPDLNSKPNPNPNPHPSPDPNPNSKPHPSHLALQEAPGHPTCAVQSISVDFSFCLAGLIAVC